MKCALEVFKECAALNVVEVARQYIQYLLNENVCREFSLVGLYSDCGTDFKIFVLFVGPNTVVASNRDDHHGETCYLAQEISQKKQQMSRQHSGVSFSVDFWCGFWFFSIKMLRWLVGLKPWNKLVRVKNRHNEHILLLIADQFPYFSTWIFLALRFGIQPPHN